ncbi:MAG: cytochrome o ubiquinol oxidase subunit I, partial [Candidatus Thiodiazotropha sp.]
MTLGKLSLESIPYHSMIIMSAVAFMALTTLVIVALITRYNQWGYLWREWLTSVDHKRIGIMYIVLALVMLLRGFIDALMMRLQQAMAAGADPGYLPAHHFDQIFSAHGTIMIFFMAMPFLTGLINFVVPQQIGARDVAFPFLNAVSLWLTSAAAMLVMISLAVGEFSTAGWTGYPPYSELQYSPSVGVDYWIWALQIGGIGSSLTGINFLVTILRNRAPGMTLMRMPLFTWTALCTSILIVLSFPALTVVTAMLALDRYLDMHFFTNAAGGNMMNFANLFWIWGHPEVYILILPAFGIFSEVVATFSSKRLFGYHSLVWATMAIALLSFTVWVHHFFTMGASANVNAAFGIATMLIAIPTGVKLFDWLMTLYRGRVRFTTPMLWTLGFIPSFAIGGATGVMLAVPPVDFMVHNSEFLVAHFHNMLIPGSLFGYLAGYMYWFPKAFGFRLDERWGRRAFWNWLFGFHLAFLPLYVLGLMGMPRRMAHYDNPAWQPWLILAAVGALFILIGIICLVVQLIVSIRQREALADTTGDPWDGRTLEWSNTSPPPVYNFALIPRVDGIDAFAAIKQKGESSQRHPVYQPIPLPRNTPAGFIIGGFAFVLGFALVWHIWWLAAVATLGILAVAAGRG